MRTAFTSAALGLNLMSEPDSVTPMLNRLNQRDNGPLKLKLEELQKWKSLVENALTISLRADNMADYVEPFRNLKSEMDGLRVT